MKITNDMTPQMVNSELGKRIQRYRLSLNMKQSELSKRSGVSIATLRRLEAGDDVSMGKLNAVLLTLGLSSNLEYLVPDDGPGPIEYATLGHGRKRASSHEKTVKTIDWGE